MAYQGRVVIAGNYQGNPFTGFVAQSRSDPNRAILQVTEKDKPLVNIVPTGRSAVEDYQNFLRGHLGITHNAYTCSYGFNEGDTRFAVSCNGRFGGAFRNSVRAGDDLFSALHCSLRGSDPIENDPRLIAVAYATGSSIHYLLGSRDINTGIRLFGGDQHIGEDRAKYLSLTSSSELKDLELPKRSLDNLAEHLFNAVLAGDTKGPIGAAAWILTPDGPKISTFNLKKK